ncbi:MAG TPA: 4-hydroxybenzoate octaprenyltransferase [Tepidisphaeraceae bacterium]|nr:4-hydroxybenzoate octaprenyltransferase [Tepidisphaeraceae bacterium]
MSETQTIPTTASQRFSTFARDIKISHSIFALPWALLSTFLAARGWPRPVDLGLIVLCMVTARTVAMSSNRLLDAQLDARNPRTANRAIPSGKLSRHFYWIALLVCSFAFVGATSLFWFLNRNPWPIALSVPVLLFVSAYPLLKRFTRLCHYYLGAALGLAPICAWIAINPHLGMIPIHIAIAVLLWTAGFDIIYACQDYQNDLETGVISVPVKFGIGPALWIARATHLLSFWAMLIVGFHGQQLGILYLIGVGCAGVLLITEHLLIRANDLSKVGIAFFTMNGIISLLVGTLGIIDVLMH